MEKILNSKINKFEACICEPLFLLQNVCAINKQMCLKCKLQCGKTELCEGFVKKTEKSVKLC